jgi:hypothetical protein
VNCPGWTIEMTPAQVHIHIEELFRAGFLLTITVGDPGAQGAGITGTQGMGVSTPKAAEVADTTVGFAIEVHMPKGRILVIGMMSMIVAAGIFVAFTLATGRTIIELGATPKVHCIIAP